MLRLSLCNYSDAYQLVKRTIRTANATAINGYKRNKGKY